MIFEILVKMAIQIMGKNLENQKYVDFVKIRKFTLALCLSLLRTAPLLFFIKYHENRKLNRLCYTPRELIKRNMAIFPRGRPRTMSSKIIKRTWTSEDDKSLK